MSVASSLWLLPLAIFTAGKQQRNTSGKAQRDTDTGKLRRNTDTTTSCCCGGQPCIFCNITFLKASYTFATGGGDFPIGMFDGDYWLPFDTVGGAGNLTCFFRGICQISYTGPVSGLHYKAMEVSAPGIILGTGANAGKLIVPNFSSMSIRMWDDANVAHTAHSATITPAVIATSAGCNEHLVFSNASFAMDLVKDNGGSGAPLCTSAFCVEDSPAACGY